MSFLVLICLLSCCASTWCLLFVGDSCKLDHGGMGTCRKIHDCPYAINLLHNKIKPQTCGFDRFTPIVCCVKDGPMITDGDIIVKKPQKNNRPPGFISEKKCVEYQKVFVKENVTREPFDVFISVFGGKEATRLQFPHMALIGFQADDDPKSDIKWGCGGSIISDEFILTAAHCVQTTQLGLPKFVMYGVIDVNDKDRIITRVKRAIPHPEYNLGINYNDIALLQLEKKIQLNEKARPACLYQNPKVKTIKASMAGFGKIGLTGDGSDKLLYVDLNIFTYKECNDVYTNVSNAPQGIREDVMICAGSYVDLQDACKGDSGGPLQIVKTDFVDGPLYDIIGIVSFGKPCGQATRWPGVYTRVSAYIKWIEDIVWPEE